MHVDLCPRLTHVLPFMSPAQMINSSFRFSLETLEIVWCGDLRAVFSLDQEQEEQDAVTLEFPELKRIHLHELPMLHGICGTRVWLSWRSACSRRKHYHHTSRVTRSQRSSTFSTSPQHVSSRARRPMRPGTRSPQWCTTSAR
jgi:hypothetical protein